MKRKIIIYAAGGALFIAAFIFALTQWSSVYAQTDGATGVSAVMATSSLYGAPQGDTFDIATAQGSVTVDNIYNLPLIVDGEYLIIDNTADYQINYNTDTSQFDLYFNATPSDSLKTQGESDFLKLLNISKQDACKLNVLEESPNNLALAETANELSICGSSTSTFSQ